MKFQVTRTSGGKQPTPKSVQVENRWFIELNSLEELIKFIDDDGNEIILYLKEDCPCIEIYDDWRE